MPKGHALAQYSGVGDETVECVSLRKLRYLRHRSRILCANALVLERVRSGCAPFAPGAGVRKIRWPACVGPSPFASKLPLTADPPRSKHRMASGCHDTGADQAPK